MADNKQSSDEYQMPELDDFQEDTYEQPSYDTPRSKGFGSSLKENPVLKKAGIVVVIVIVAMIAYRFFGSMLTSDGEKAKSSMPDLSKSKPAAPKPPPPMTETIAPIPRSVPSTLSDSEDAGTTAKKIASLEISQQSVREDISNINGQIGSINSTVSELTDKIASINQNLQILMDKLENQASELHRMRAMRHAKKTPRRKVVVVPKVTWNVQAVVPGRAWLIASNGSTLTVRKGSAVPGMGTVNLIDTEQGKVILSSGRVIGFSPQDS